MKLTWFFIGSASMLAALLIVPVLVGVGAALVKTRFAHPVTERIVYVDCGGPNLPACHAKASASATAGVR